MLLCWWGCGWVDHETRDFLCPGFGVWGFGMLLGPEETPGLVGLFSLVAVLGSGRLTHLFSRCWWGCGGGCGGWGCGGVLSVA